jgi:hypothetical protein
MGNELTFPDIRFENTGCKAGRYDMAKFGRKF